MAPAAGGTLTLLKEPKVKKVRKRKAAPKPASETETDDVAVEAAEPVAEAHTEEPEVATDEQEGGE